MSANLSHILQEKFQEEFKISGLSGGDINEAFRCTSTNHDLAVKVNSKDRFPGMFAAEASGLEHLASSDAIRTPNVKGVLEDETSQYLLLEFIAGGMKTKEFWLNFGRQLAALHQTPAKYFGLKENNYIGSLKQDNTREEQWSDFIVLHRFEPMLKMARDKGEITSAEQNRFEQLYPRINEIWPNEIPHLIHGDLWAGNYLVDENNEVVLIDPAVYCGHREIDIGMMHLFGGFDPALFDSYNNEFPLENGWEDRIPYNQLYPLLVHVNLFGRSYWSAIDRTVSQL